MVLLGSTNNMNAWIVGRMREQRQRTTAPTSHYHSKHNHHHGPKASSSSSSAISISSTPSRYNDYGDLIDDDDDDEDHNDDGLDDLIGDMAGLGLEKSRKTTEKSSGPTIRANANVFDIVGRSPSAEGSKASTHPL